MVNNNFDKRIKNITSKVEPPKDFIDFTDSILDSLEPKSQPTKINRFRRLPMVASFVLIFLFIFLSPVYAQLTSVFDSFKSLNIFNKDNSDDYINSLNITAKDSDVTFNFKNLVISGDSIILSYKATTPYKPTSLPGIWDSDVNINGKKVEDPLTEDYGTLISEDNGYTYDMVSIIDILDIKNISENDNIKLNYTIKNFDGVDGKWDLSLNLPKEKLYDKVYYADTNKTLETSQGDITFDKISLGQFYTKALYTVNNTSKDFKFAHYIIKTDKNETLLSYRGTSASLDGSSTGEDYFSPIKEKPDKIWIIPYETNYDLPSTFIKEIPAKDLMNLPKPYSIKISEDLTLNLLETSYENNNLKIKYKFDGTCFDPHIVSLKYNDDSYVNQKYGFNPNLIRADEGTLTYEISNLDDFKLKVVNQNHIIPEYDKQLELSVK
ncbi:DUF4179 domain-containing protein [Clostridium intestinale]|uniref:DUF4179 domain-containing protein n=1 Tax=Clostridium intestinale TaxID=36845 RepID=A0A7D6VSH1_9CLOT|nr:DUF4179 domain-containing protein [Clostridium intestinale]QLY78670.1 DUF4179 domain-containing protein [Clostridium intestinale]